MSDIKTTAGLVITGISTLVGTIFYVAGAEIFWLFCFIISYYGARWVEVAQLYPFATDTRKPVLDHPLAITLFLGLMGLLALGVPA